MVVDTSAVAAVLLAENDARLYAAAIIDAERVSLSAGSYLELAIVIDNRGDITASREFEALLRSGSIGVVPVSLTQAEIARHAYLTYGRGRHPARLNFGDCFAYALAKELGEPLLFKGTDFALTDIKPALAADQA